MFASLTRFAVAATIGFAASTAIANDKVVNVYNWSDYIAADTLEKFTKETGIRVKYDTFSENEILDTKLMAGRSGYDVVFPSASPFFAQQVKAGIYQKLDLAKIPNAKALDKDVMASMAMVDPNNAYSVPYMIAATGIGYNVDQVQKILGGAPDHSWATLLDPAQVSKLKGCGVSVLDTPTELVPAYLIWKGKDPHDQTKETLAEAMDGVTPIRPSLRYVNSEKYRADLANGDICMAHGYVGDLVQTRALAKESQKPQNIEIFIPKEGALVNIDVMAIPADAPNVEAAHAFINFILRPDIIAEITDETGYANAVPDSLKLVDPEIANDPVIFPPADVKAKLFTPPPPATREYDRLRARAWSRFRAAKG